MKTSPRLHWSDENGKPQSESLLPVPVRLIANDARQSTGVNWNRRVRDWMQA
jgi:hypothetical protein